MRTASALAGFGFALVAGFALAGCGSDSGSPTEPSPRGPGPFTGTYTLEIRPLAGCELPGAPYRIAVQIVSVAAARQEVRAILPGGDTMLALELLYVTPETLRGAIGTKQPVRFENGMDVYLRDIGTGTVTRASDGRGQVLDGTMTGDVAAGDSTCTSEDHRW